jgi:hypothetical protein
VFKQYKSLFGKSDTASEEHEQTDGPTFEQHWGWFSTVYRLSQTPILNITGDKSIPELNFVFVLNYLSIDKDYNMEQEKKRKQYKKTSKIY